MLSPYNPSSNGSAESGVKISKYLMIKCIENGQDFTTALFEHNATIRADGSSPANIYLGRKPRSAVPALTTGFEAFDLLREKEMREAGQAKMRQGLGGTKFHGEEFAQGDEVVVQDPKSGRWRREATVLRAREGGRSYEVEDDRGQIRLRNGKFFRPLVPGNKARYVVAGPDVSALTEYTTWQPRSWAEVVKGGQ